MATARRRTRKARVTGAKCSQRTSTGQVRSSKRAKACRVTGCRTRGGKKIRATSASGTRYGRCDTKRAGGKFSEGKVTITGPKKRRRKTSVSGLAARRRKTTRKLPKRSKRTGRFIKG